GRTTLDTVNANTIPALILQMDRCEISDAIRRDVLVRIAHLVDQLLLNGRDDYPTTRALVFGDHERSIRRSFDDRETDVSKIRDTAPLVLAIATRSLRSAFDDVTSNRAGSEMVPIVMGPAKLVNHRRQR